MESRFTRLPSIPLPSLAQKKRGVPPLPSRQPCERKAEARVVPLLQLAPTPLAFDFVRLAIFATAEIVCEFNVGVK